VAVLATTAGKVCGLTAASTASTVFVFLAGLAVLTEALGKALGSTFGAGFSEALGVLGFETATLVTPHISLL
jgi:hypothetical protein